MDRTRRRALGLGSAFAAMVAYAQLGPVHAAAPPQVVFLSQDLRRVAEPVFESIMAHLAQWGDARERDYRPLLRYVERQPDRVPALAREAVALRPALIVAHANLVIAALRRETKDIPIVMVNAVSPVALGFVDSLARPGGNITGTTFNPLEIGGKMVEVLHGVAPKARRVTLVWNPDSQGGAMRQYQPFVDRAAQRLRVAYTYLDVRKPEDFTREGVLATQPDALMIATDPVTATLMPQIIQLALERRLPSLSVARNFVDEGGLVAVLADQAETQRNVADLVHRILHGARPGDLPVLEPSRFQVILNLKVARSIGLAVSQEALLQATEVIE